MRAFGAFSKKEAVEMIRTYKFLIMICVFAVIGILNPVTARIAPQVVGGLLPDNVKIDIPEPTAMDSWSQFFKNVPQMGLVVMVIVFSGIMSGEFSRGTLVNLLTKGLSRHTVVLAKFFAMSVLWSVSYLMCFALSYAYTAYFWPGGHVDNLFCSILFLWLFALLLISCLILGGILFNRGYGAMLFTGGVVVLLFLINILPVDIVRRLNPAGLVSKNMMLLSGQASLSELAGAAVMSAVMTAAVTGLSVIAFNKKRV